MKRLLEVIGIEQSELEDWRNKTKVTNIISLDEFLEQGSESSFDSKDKSIF